MTNLGALLSNEPVPGTTGGAAASDATTSTKGIVQLAGDLTGTAVSPQIAAGVITNADVNGSAAIAESKLALASDAGAGTASRRTIGQGTAVSACSDTDSRLSNTRTPTAHASTHQPGGPDAMAVDAAAATGSLRTLGTGAGQAAPGNDTRFVPASGTTDQLLKKNSGTNYDTGWTSAPTVTGLTMPTPGNAKARLTTLTGTNDWAGFTLNCAYTGAAWNLDDTSLAGWYFKLDSRGSSPEFAVYRIPAGANPHTDEQAMFRVNAASLVTVVGRITGVATPTGGSDATNKTYVDGKAGYYSTATHGAGTTITVGQAIHGLRASRGLIVQVQAESTGAIEFPDVTVATNGDVTVTFQVSVSANSKRITILG